ncbi:patatin-like phospholipase domain-containing protein 2 [Limulus polyphemus]|uniref:Patatin-like phospholipase domain-containing protein 2 n=1 Tax=Limulus polyphemus TaxID=6850 RepID=A0ABM1B0H7_LIMPO|nr:patatin-like phospholipase domain-containing protein 2 [Limulus polyphemus]XP_022239037.1 patatin-like phospholipase domain-containing protein 2 [Limulus polyphemus]
MNLSFAGCGFLGIYHVGVASCFREYAPHVLVEKIAGASAGALTACCLICEVPLGESTTDVLKIAVKARSRVLGPFHPGFDINTILYDGLVKILPSNAHLRCSGRLHISVTRVSDGENVLLTQFDSRKDLIQALLCSCFVPFYSGLLPPKFHGVAYMDGCFSNNLPILDENTVTVSPFCGESDICPQDSSFNIMQISLANTSIAISPSNLYRFTTVLFPPHPEILSKMCQQGFDDTLKFLQRHNLISCMRCLAVQSSFLLKEGDNPEDVNEEMSYALDVEGEYDGCSGCQERQQIALLDSLPETVVRAIQEATDQVNKGVINWVFRHKPVKLLSLLTLPYVLPFDVTVVIFCKIWQMVPTLQKEVRSSLVAVLGIVKTIIHSVNRKRHQYSAKFSCQLAITEYDYSLEDTPAAYLTSMNVNSLASQGMSRSYPFFVDRQSKSMEDIRIEQGYNQSITSWLPRRRRSTGTEVRGPERIINSMEFGFTINLDDSIDASSSQKRKLMTAFRSLSEDDNLRAIDIANKALNLDLNKFCGTIESKNADNFERILEATANHDALMAFYYLDDNMQVKVTEIFNVTNADTSAFLSPEEQEANNQMEWEDNYGLELMDPPQLLNLFDQPEDSIYNFSEDFIRTEGDGMSDSHCPSPLSRDYRADIGNIVNENKNFRSSGSGENVDD